jgi:hypothetical protein
MKTYTTGAGEYGFDAIINGQTPLVYNDLLAQVGTQRDLRTDAILLYENSGLEGLLSQIQDLLAKNGGIENREVVASPYFWPEYTDDVVITTIVKRATAAGAAGASVTLVIDGSSHSGNGKFSVPRKGFRAYIVELGGQCVEIDNVVKTPNLGHTITISPINGEALDLTVLDYYTLLVDPLRNYVKGTTDQIQTGGFVRNPPTIRKGYVQMFETGYEIHQDELNGYVYDVDFRIGKGVDANGKETHYYDFPTMNQKMLEDYTDSKIINILFNQRNEAKQQGFDGLIPAVEREGMFNRFYDKSSGQSLKSAMFNKVRQLRARNGATENLIAHDFGWGMDWSENLAQLVKDSKDRNYRLFGEGGEGLRNFKWYQFKDFQLYGYAFKTFQVDTFDKARYGAPLKDFALTIPMTTYRDTKGRPVGPVSFVNIKGSEMAPEKKMWIKDTRPDGFRTVKFFCQDTWGMEQHATMKMGIERKVQC